MTAHVRSIPAWAKAIYLCVVIAVLVWAIGDSISQFHHWRSVFADSSVYMFMAAWMAMAFLLGAWWALLLRWRFNAKLSIRQWLPVQALAWSGRYLPGKLGLLAGKFALLGREKLDGKRLAYSVLWEQLAFVLAAAIAAAIFLTLPLAGSPEALVAHWGWARLLAGFGGLVLFLTMDMVFKRVWPGALESACELPIHRRLCLALLYLLPHMLVGVGAYPLMCALIPGAAPLGATGMIGLLALANMVGILAIFAPAGIGVREAVLGLGLLPFAPLSSALAFAAVLRLITVLADATFFLLAGGLALLCRRRALRAG